MRLDRWLADECPILGRRGAKLWCENGHVTVNGRPAAKSLRLVAEMEIGYDVPEAPRAQQNWDLHLDIRLETPQVAVVYKPAGQPTAAHRDHRQTALANALAARYPEMSRFGNPLEAGLIHRLDNGTSGLLVAARTQAAYDTLCKGLHEGRLDKEYFAIVEDHELPASGLFDTPLRPHPRNSKRMTAATLGQPGARQATTRFEVLERSNGLAAVRAFASPALRHQIRAHFAIQGCPLVNDEAYGGARHKLLTDMRHALHARRISWAGAAPVPAFDCTAALADDLVALLRDNGFTASTGL